MNVMKRFAFESRWHLLENYFQNKRKCREGPTLPDICKFIAKFRQTSFIVDALRRESAPIERTLQKISV